MHRSGTSAAAQLLQGLGLETAPPSALLKADADNIRGYVEPERLVQINDFMLDRVHGSWDVPPTRRSLRRTRHWDVPRRSKPEILGLLPPERWFVKDPRLSLTLHLWRPHLPQIGAVVLCLRSPLEVARSLVARDGLSVAHSIALWEHYWVEAAFHSANSPTYVLEYEELLTQPRRVIGGLADFLTGVGLRPDVDAAVVADRVDTAPRSQSAVDTIEYDGDALRAYAAYRELGGPHKSFPTQPYAISPRSREVLDSLRVERRTSVPPARRLRQLVPPSVHVLGDLLKSRRSNRDRPTGV